MDDLDAHQLLTCDYRQLCLDSFYLSYKGNILEERPDALYRMMCNLRRWNATLEDVMQSGQSELDQFDEFLELWIGFLSARQERNVERLIREAQSLINDDGQSLENARKYADQYPVLYEQYLSRNLTAGDDQKFFEIGWEALTAVPDTYTVRSQIALLTAGYALRIQKIDEVERCWLEAFRSKKNPVNYMRIFIESRDYSRFKKEITDICGSIDKTKNEHYYTLLFLNGKFPEVIAEGMNAKEALGWSFTFMKKGIGLFLLYLYHGKGLPAGLRKMCSLAAGDLAFSKEAYCQGLERNIEQDDFTFFWECFCRWKEKILISDGERQMIMEKLEALIELRVEGIMQSNKRKYYGECAAFVAACGEVKESWGEQLGKEKFMSTYRYRYPRRSAFRQELQSYGYKG